MLRAHDDIIFIAEAEGGAISSYGLGMHMSMAAYKGKKIE